MKVSVAVAIIVFLLQSAAYGQSTLTFAYLMDYSEIRSVQFAILNPGKEAAETALTLYSAVGQVVEKTNAVVPAGGQLIRSAAQMFPRATTGGWVEATSNVAGLRGFWMTGDEATLGDNAEAESSDTEQILPLVTDTSDIVVVNTGSRDTAIRMKLYAVNGREVSEPIVRVLPPKGAFKASATALFTARDWSSVTHAKISSGTPVAVAAQVRDFRSTPSLSLVNAMSVPAGASTFVFPHVLQGPLGDSRYITTLGITNLNSSSQTMTLTFYPSDGSTPQTIQRTYPGNGGVRASIRTIFGFRDEFRAGWVKVTAPRAAVGFASNAETEQGSATFSPGVSKPGSDLILGYIAVLQPWWTGLTLVNPGSQGVAVEIFAISPEGTLIGGANDTPAAHFEIPPNGKRSRLLTEWIARTQSVHSHGGFIYVRSTGPIYGLGLVFTRDLRILSLIPGFALPPAVYDPLQPGVRP